MARLASLEKGGYYPLPDRITDILVTWVRPTPGNFMLDPFAGEGKALAELASAWGFVPYGIEVNEHRYNVLKERLSPLDGKAVHSAVEFVDIAEGAFHLLYTNPPYDGQSENAYVLDNLKWLTPGGTLIAVLPERSALQYGFLHQLSTRLDTLAIRRFPLPEYEQFKQVLVVGTKRAHRREVYYGSPTYNLLSQYENIPVAGKREFDLTPRPNGLYRPIITVSEPTITRVLAEADEHGVTTTPLWETLMEPSADDLAFRPLETPKAGHAAMLIAAGVLNGTKIESGESKMLVKGRTRKYSVEETTKEEEDSRVNEEVVETERLAVQINVFNLNTGEMTTYDSHDPEPYQQFLSDHAAALHEALAERHRPKFEPGKHLDRYLPLFDRFHAPGKLAGADNADNALPAQQEKAAALAFALESEKAALLVGEMGTGKTVTSIAALYLKNARAYEAGANVKTVVMCPAHLVGKWKREVEACLREFGVKAHIITSVSDIDRAMSEPGPSYLILSKEKAKLGSGWENAFARRRKRVTYEIKGPIDYGRYYTRRQVSEVIDALCCPNCGEIIRDDDEIPLTEETWGKQQRRCVECDAPLWQQTPLPSGRGRYPLGIYINKHHAGRYSLILDEAQHYKGATTDQALASMHLVSGAQKVIAMTGTIYGGKASSLFHLLYRLSRDFRAHYAHDDVERFIDHYGLRQRITRASAKRTTYGSTWGYKRLSTRVKEIPGASPSMVGLLLPRTAFMGLADIGVALPPYEEHVRLIDMGDDLADHYRRGIMSRWRDDALQALRDGDASEFSLWLHGALGWPDCPEQGEGDYAPALEPPAGGWNKDSEVIELITQEIAEGRRCFLYCGQVNRRDPRPRLAHQLAKRGIRAVSMDGTIAPEKREEWLEKAVKKGAQVIMANPGLVETGLDLIAFPTLIYLGIPTYSIYTIEQSKRRSWRLGQTEPVNVYFFVYGGTLQEVAIKLLSDKARAADLVHGDVSRGLAALNAPQSDFLTSLKTQIASGEADAMMRAWRPRRKPATPSQNGRTPKPAREPARLPATGLQQLPLF